MKKYLCAMLAAMMLGMTFPTLAQDQAATPPAPSGQQGGIAAVTTSHRLALPDQAIDYRAVAGTLPILDVDGTPRAHIAVIAYLAEGTDAGSRPVTFVFNGGPGASSAYLNLGALGPRGVVMGAGGAVLSPPAGLQDNPDSWLAFTDLVFIDPVGAGFSRAAKPGEEAEKAFWSISADTRSMAELIRLWLARNARWASPKFIAGESYGGYRAAQLARALLDDEGVALNGLVMISPALDLSLLDPDDTEVLPWALALPSMAAAARSHGKSDAAMSFDTVEQFALTDYLVGIAAITPAGPGPDPALIDRLTGLLGLDKDIVRRHHGRVPTRVFAKRLLEDTGRSLSLYDGTQTGPDPHPAQGGGPDPQLEATKAPLSTAYNAHVRGELNLQTDLPFHLLADRPSRHWDWEGARGGPGRHDGAMDELAEAMALTPGLGVLVVHGRADMVTPYMVSRWLLDRLDLPEEVRGRARLEVLDGGHMMYFDPPQRAALHQRAADFYRRQTTRP